MRTSNSKRLARLLTVAVIFAMLIIAVIPVATFAAESQPATVAESTSGITTTPGKTENWKYFKEDTSYDMTTKVAPITFEFELTGTTHIAGAQKGGVIIGNYSENASTYINIEAIDYGKIIVRGKYNGGAEWTATFYQSEADIRVGGVTHYTVVVASGWTGVSLYVNGSHKATRYPASLTIPKASEYTHPFRIGGDYSSGNTNYFKGMIYSVAMFNDVRTADEINADKNINKTWSSSTSGLIAAYDLTRMGAAALRDYSGNGNVLSYNNGSGIQVENFGKYEIDKQLESTIETFEAWINMPDYYHGKIGGTIVGNYRTANGARVWLEVYADGNPRLAYTNANGTTSYHRFTSVDLRNGVWTHLAIVHDVASGEARCYVDGELVQTLTENVLEYSDKAYDQKFLIGRDSSLRYAEGDGEYWENRKDQYFKGFIKEVRLYSDVRSAEEIAADYNGSLDKTDAGLLACYQISPENAYQDLVDVSGNGYTAAYKQLLWEKEYVEPIQNNYSYSLALVGDTQTVTYQNPELLKNIYKWILDNQTSKNIQYVIGLGDITEYGVDVGHANYDEARANAEWTAAKEAISLMDGNIPYSLIRGDGHDGINLFNQYFAQHDGYTSNIAGYYQEGKIDNVYHTFRAGTVDYLLLCLDHGTKDDVLVWANEVVASHPNHRVIVTTHHYMKSDGSLSVKGETGNATAYDPNNNAADELWNEFLTKHPNISMVICGHADADDVVVSKKIGDHGNEVTQILVDPQTMDAEFGQGSKGMVAMLYFSEDGTEVQVEYYSTLKDTYRPSTGFTVEQGDHNYSASVTAPTCTDGGYTTYTCSGCGDSYVGDQVAATGHNYSASVTAPTCTDGGYTTYTCSGCGDSYVGDQVAATGHNYGASVTAPTCTDGGYTAYTCSICGDSYVGDQVAATGHNYSASVTAPTCTAGGYTTNTCSTCGDSYTSDETSAKGHTETTLPAVAPTCIATGLTEGKQCSVCGTTTVEQSTVAALGHSYSATVTAPTCTAGGYTTNTCSTCGDTYTSDETAAKGHTWNNCECTACGTVLPTLEKTDSFVFTSQAGFDAAVASGKLGFVGTFRDNSGSFQFDTNSTIHFVVPANTTVTVTGHSAQYGVFNIFLNGEKADLVASNGVYTFNVKEETKVVIATGDQGASYSYIKSISLAEYVDRTIVADTTITFGSAGNYKDSIVDFSGIQIGDNGGNNSQIKNGSFELLLKAGSKVVIHGYPGYTSYQLNGSAEITDEFFTFITTEDTVLTVTPVNGNNYFYSIEITLHEGVTLVDAKAPTCIEAGYGEHYVCTCHAEPLTAKGDVDALGHTEQTLTAVAPTCTATGLTEGKQCSVCGTVTVEQTVVPTIAHSYDAVVTDPTCAAGGYTTYTCSVCGDTYTANETAAIPHTEQTLSGKTPTCTETGLTEGKKCLVCGTTTVEQSTVPATGHTEEALSAVAPTCTESGLTEGKKCSVCGTTTVEQTEVPATSHTWKDATEDAPKTCETCGATEGDKLPATTPNTDLTVEKNHDECAASGLEKFFNAILNFLRELFGLPAKCICGDEL